MSSQCLLNIEPVPSAAPSSRILLDFGKRSSDLEPVPLRMRSARPLRVIGHLLLELPRPAWMILDTAVIWLATVLGYGWFGVAAHAHHAQVWLSYGVFAFATMVGSLIFGLNERAALTSRWHIVTRMVMTTLLSSALTYFIIYVVLYMRLSRRVAALTVVTYLTYGVALRLFACFAIHRIKRRLVVVGSQASCESFISRMKDGFLNAHEVVGVVRNPGEKAAPSASGLKNLGSTEEIIGICRKEGIHDIVVCNGGARNPEVMAWLLPCLRMGCRVRNEATFYETSAGQILVDEITPDWFLFTDLSAHCAEYASLKRIFDMIVAVVGLAVSLPWYPLIALAIRLEDGGAVFYAQDRVGKGGAIFKLYKFRTMRPNAECGRNVWASRHDPRITRVGKILRRTRLDEFPQFFNILVGEMSVVGPRPERPAIVMDLCRRIPFWSERNLVKPGLTGWAQISFRYGNTYEDAKRKLQFDFYYLKHMGLELDVIILFRTLGTFLRGAC